MAVLNSEIRARRHLTMVWFQYVNIGLILDPSIERMNPESVETFDFDYNDKMELDSCTRTAFSYGRVISHKWKIKKSIIRSYIECGIGWLGK